MSYKTLSSAQKITSSFIAVILIGTILLAGPWAHQIGKSISLLDALFVATSATCVTGLTPIVVSDVFNEFGQLILLTLIQIGGLGFITIVAFVGLILRNKLSLRHTYAVKDMINRDEIFEFRKFLTSIIIYTLMAEFVGAVWLSLSLTQHLGFWGGIKHALFLSISAFCNAGFDLLGAESLSLYVHDISFQLAIMVLIINGGIGFAVWKDMMNVIKALLKKEPIYRAKKYMTLHTKITIVMTTVLTLVMAILFLVLEGNNPIMETLTTGEKVMAALFQSVTLRTAGFYTVNFGAFKYVTLLIMIPFMFIGGSSGGTAGGVKSTTIFVLFAYLWAYIKGKGAVVVGKRQIPMTTIHKAFVFVFINLLVAILGSVLLSLEATSPKLMAYLFEAFSALGTVGISTGITPMLSDFGKIVIIMLMFLGRIGILTFVSSISRPEQSKQNIQYPSGKIIVG